jgi:hypothetical protein
MSRQYLAIVGTLVGALLPISACESTTNIDPASSGTAVDAGTGSETSFCTVDGPIDADHEDIDSGIYACPEGTVCDNRDPNGFWRCYYAE